MPARLAALVANLDAGSRALSYLLGAAALALAVAATASSRGPGDIAGWVAGVLGVTFTLLLAALVFVALLGWVKISRSAPHEPGYGAWLEAGVQAAGGIAALALTYTLLGVALGIGTLAEQPLSPSTVQGTIKALTRHFSMAFMTTVIGLPVSTALRTLLLVTHARRSQAPAPAKGEPL